MSDQPLLLPAPAPINRAGRLDLLVSDGLGLISQELGRRFGIPLREHLQPVIDRFVNDHVQAGNVPVTPMQIAERMGLIDPPPTVYEPGSFHRHRRNRRNR